MAKPTLTTSAVGPYHGGELARNGHEQVHMGNVGSIKFGTLLPKITSRHEEAPK